MQQPRKSHNRASTLWTVHTKYCTYVRVRSWNWHKLLVFLLSIKLAQSVSADLLGAWLSPFHDDSKKGGLLYYSYSMHWIQASPPPPTHAPDIPVYWRHLLAAHHPTLLLSIPPPGWHAWVGQRQFVAMFANRSFQVNGAEDSSSRLLLVESREERTGGERGDRESWEEVLTPVVEELSWEIIL